MYHFVHPSTSAFLHSSPITECSTYQSIWRDCSDGIVPVLYLYCIQRYFLYDTVRTAVGHLYPVADTDHIVLGKLNAAHKSENAVLEYEHKHRRRRTKAGKKGSGGLVNKGGCNYYAADEVNDYLDTLYDTFEWVEFTFLALAVYFQKCCQKRIEYDYADDYQIGEVQFCEQPGKIFAFHQAGMYYKVSRNSRQKEKYVPEDIPSVCLVYPI